MGKRQSRKSNYPLDTWVAFLLYAGVAAATFTIDAESRQVVLWCVLLAFGLFYRQALRGEILHPLADLGRGAAAGLILALPILLLLQPELTAIIARLLPGQSDAAAFQGLVLIAPLAEELFFRGLLQKQHGLVAGALLYGVYLLLFFLPGVVDFALVGLAVCLAGALFGFIYGYVNERYGLGAAIACHATVNLVVFFLPLVVPDVARWLKAI